MARDMAQSLEATPNELQSYSIKVNQDGVRRTVMDLLAYPDIDWEQVEAVWPQLAAVDPEIREQIECDALYSKYMDRHEADIAAFRKDEALKLPSDLELWSASEVCRMRCG